ncbi:hypothetical protein swp_1328 [Shewanella piezotolerans WP3]|uniref:Uncharacterized protein n=1 Tax=Shewanella piezotolerans (strain WP3 / JCM 13877) TaxID=225849 RepID=B8CJL8_SHEPW|nr:hypothetical protein swp_1328 [Shewanella piezotolerans WP3]
MIHLHNLPQILLCNTNQYKDLIAQREFSDFEVRQ